MLQLQSELQVLRVSCRKRFFQFVGMSPSCGRTSNGDDCVCVNSLKSCSKSCSNCLVLVCPVRRTIALPIELKPGGNGRNRGKGTCNFKFKSTDNRQRGLLPVSSFSYSSSSSSSTRITDLPWNVARSMREATNRLAALLALDCKISVLASTIWTVVDPSCGECSNRFTNTGTRSNPRNSTRGCGQYQSPSSSSSCCCCCVASSLPNRRRLLSEECNQDRKESFGKGILILAFESPEKES